MIDCVIIDVQIVIIIVIHLEKENVTIYIVYRLKLTQFVIFFLENIIRTLLLMSATALRVSRTNVIKLKELKPKFPTPPGQLCL